ncbi:MAG: hypothetical protein ACMUIG_09560 [Thermoplasmatota archaeon]
MREGFLHTALRKALERKLARKLEDLSEDDVVKWRSGMWRIAEELIDRYSEKLIHHRKLIISLLKIYTPESISREMIKRKPEFEGYWKDDIFYKRLSQEVDTISVFLLDNEKDDP